MNIYKPIFTLFANFDIIKPIVLILKNSPLFFVLITEKKAEGL